jgi:MFS family permease
VALALLVLRRTGSGLAVGILTACQYGPILLFGAWAGLIADRSDKRRLLLLTQSISMLQSFALGALAFLPHAPLPAFYVTALAGGLILAFDNPARRAFVAELVDESRVHNAVTLNGALMTGSRVVGPALAGLLVTTVGYGWAFVGDALSYLAVLAALWMIRPGELRRPVVTRKAKGQLRAGLAYVWSSPDLRVPLVMMTVVGTLTFNFSVVVPLFVVRTLGGSEATYTVLYSVLSLGSLAGALAATRWRSVGIATIARTSAAFGAAMVLLAAAPDLAAAFPAALVLGMASVSFMTLSTALVQVRADPAMRGRVLALQSIVLMGTTPIGGPLLGAVSDALGARAGLVLGGIAALGAAAWGRREGHRLAVEQAATVIPDEALEDVLGECTATEIT